MSVAPGSRYDEGMRTLVLGLGNPIVQDDAVGIRLARELHSRGGERPGVEWFPDCSAGGLELLEHLAGYDRVVVLDAIRTRDGRPGNWYRFTAAELRETRHLSSIHDANFATALELGRRLGLALPRDEEIHVFAVEIDVHDAFGGELSPALSAVYPVLVDEIGAEVAAILDDSSV
jgi:hydrogenase maturation protease